MSKVECEIKDSVALVTLNDPDRRNAIGPEMSEEIGVVMDDLESGGEAGAVVITGKGSAFCAGGSLDALESLDKDVYAGLYESFLRVGRCPLPTIAAVNGPAAGAGLNLALCCDVRVAAAGSRFVARFLDIGLHPGGGHTWMLQRAVGTERATAMLFMGEEPDGETAELWGLALKCVPDEQVVEEALALGRRAASMPAPILLRTSETIELVASVDSHAEAVEIETEAQMWSARQPYFKERLAALKARISSRS